MFDSNYIIEKLEDHQAVFRTLLSGSCRDEQQWRPGPGKWSLLEIICHLHDEECEDFRARLMHVLQTPSLPLPPIDPPGWVTARHYANQDFNHMLQKFLHERNGSVRWLLSLEDPRWDNVHEHPKFGPMSGRLFLSNWLAHDYLHIRQIQYNRYQYLLHRSGEPLNYAGSW